MRPARRRPRATSSSSRSTPSSPACISCRTIRRPAIARKALRVNLSDLAAKGATPLGFLLTLALPPHSDASMLAAVRARPGQGCTMRYGCPVLGGDTSGTPGPLAISITAFGTVPHGTDGSAHRRASRAIWCWSPARIGDAALGLKLQPAREARRAMEAVARTSAAFLIDRYREPRPRNALADAVRTIRVGRDGCVGRSRRRSRPSCADVSGVVGAGRCIASAAVANGRRRRSPPSRILSRPF